MMYNKGLITEVDGMGKTQKARKLRKKFALHRLREHIGLWGEVDCSSAGVDSSV